ncbi:hypothetical protein LTR37_014274 [Vermiconidia calcicola]|uniref:Uncharacterized protein n=1 Tax=Vermiconidia calcicola TaxID=1690605 RepID=A0ACC3MV64_9PEZI|nr:hypothetical protein LTR37_014274 [Vermiconidia calcicola]
MAPVLDEKINDSSIDDTSAKLPRFAIIGAGQRGNAYARAVMDSGLGLITAVIEPIAFKRQLLGSRYIWGSKAKPTPEQEFSSWENFIKYEQQRRKDAAAGIPTPEGVAGVFVCVRDELHIEVVKALAPLGLHMLCEKPLATTLEDCLSIQRTLQQYPARIFAIGHVLRYSPHNLLLRHLVREEQVIGEVLSLEHTEPVGWWHFSHSYVRGHWRKEGLRRGPTLLTKSCHDIDWVLWMLCSPPPPGPGWEKDIPPHLPSNISSRGSLKQFRRAMKPKEAGEATNCLSCPIKETCMYSAPRIYHDRHLVKGNAKWPVEIVNPEIESMLTTSGLDAAKQALFESLAEDYDAATTPVQDIESRPWFGRCVWESDNDVCDDQFVTFEWDDSPETGIGAKTANFHMIAHSLAQCERRGVVYGTTGEIHYDSKQITVHSFMDDTTEVFKPEVPKNSHHGGGDDGLAQQFVKAVATVDREGWEVGRAQKEFLGVTVEECVRSHAAVFCAEEARREGRVVDWGDWWREHVEIGKVSNGMAT